MNFLAIIVAGLLNFLIGMVWYGPAFGKMWMKLSGVKDMKPAPMSLVVALIASIIMAFTLNIVITLIPGLTLFGGAMIGIVMSLGTIGMASMGMTLWEKKPIGLYLLNTAYDVLAYAVMGALLVAWV